MTKQELQTRIDKKNSDIAKIEKRIAKWGNGIPENEKASIKEYADAIYKHYSGKMNDNEYHLIKEEYFSIPKTPDNDDFNKGPNREELRRAYIDLCEATATLDKYQTAINSIANFDKMEKIKVIWDFLQQWRTLAYQYYIDNAKRYVELNKGRADAWAEFTKSEQYKNLMNARDEYDRRFGDYEIERRWDEKYYASISSFTKEICSWSGNVDTNKLNNALDKEVVAKYRDLVARITEKAGEIKDATGLQIGPKGDINGYVIGTKNTVHVETIGAGGEHVGEIVNVKCGPIYHYRSIVNIIK
jgi:hypothetical protein